MIRISLPFIFKLANDIEPLASLPEQQTTYGEIWVRLAIAEQTIRNLVEGSLYSPYLRTSYAAAQELLNILRSQISKSFEQTRTIEPYETWAIRNSYSQYKIALLAELGALSSYFVTQKGGFDTVSLLAFGENLFPTDLGTKVPEAIFDAKEAGKCLAYEASTACGFHVFRITESVLRKYYSHVTGGAAAPKVRSLGVYVTALKKAGKGDEKILAALKQMTDLHRNPLIHPETILTVDEAIAIFGIARSAITAMLTVLPIVPPTTSAFGIPVPNPALPGPSVAQSP